MLSPSLPLRLLLPLLLLAIPHALRAQERGDLRLGITIARAIDFHQTESIPWPWPENPQSMFWGNSIDFSAKIGIAGEYRFDSTWGIIAHLDYVSGSARFTQQRETPEPFEVEFGDGGGGSDTNISNGNFNYEHNARTTYRHIDLALMGSRTILGNDSTYRIALALGPVVSRTLLLNLRQTVEVIQDKESYYRARFVNSGGYAAEDNGETLILYDGEIPTDNDWQFGLRAGLCANVGSVDGNGVLFSPGIYLDYGLTSLLSLPNEWRTISVTGRVDVTFGL